MDINKHGLNHEHQHKNDHEHSQYPQNHPEDRFPLPTVSSLSQISSSARSSQDSQDSVLGIGSHVHPPTPDMDGSDGYRRRRALLASEHEASKSSRRMRGERTQRSHKKATDMQNQGIESDDTDTSDFSSRSISDDVELYHIGSDNGLTDDEEAGLDKKDKSRRKRKKRKNTLLDQRVIGSMKISIQNGDSADKNVLKASIINALLIASWYFFSLSISMVSP